MSVDPRRSLALAALLAVRRGKPLAGELQRVRSALGEGQRAAAVEERVRGALQWQGRYDHLIALFSSRRTTGDPMVRAVLHLALHELLSVGGVPDYAVLHQAGELLRRARLHGSIGYVNALLHEVLRHVASRAPMDPLEAVHELFARDEAGPEGYLAAWWSHPLWLVRRWCARFGRQQAAALLEWSNIPASITLHVLPGRDVEAVQSALAGLGLRAERVDRFPRALRLAGRISRARLRAVLQDVGGLLVQDTGAQAALDWLTRAGTDLAAIASPTLDLCAAPGGKSVHMRALMPPESLLVAMDIRAERLQMVRQNRDRLGLSSFLLLVGDGTRPPLRAGSCSAVLLDGPCSGTGVMRRHPEGRWRLHPDTLRQNAARLLRLGAAAADLLVDGGRLYYATCSLEPEENEKVIETLLGQRRDLAADPDQDGRFFRSWLPWVDGTDGFFAARLRRRAGAGHRQAPEMGGE